MIGGSNKSVTNRDLTSTIKIKARNAKSDGTNVGYSGHCIRELESLHEI